MRPSAAKYSRANVRLASFWSQYQGSVKMRPWAVLNVVDEDQQAGKLLAALDDAEFRGLLYRVDGVAAGIGKPDDLRLEAFACSRNDEKSVPGNGWRTLPSTLPPLFTTTASVSRSSA